MNAPTLPSIASATITQHNCVAHGAPSGRWWRDHIPRLGIRFARIGSLVVVRTEDWLRYVEAHTEELLDEPAESTDDVLRDLGYRRAGGSR